MYSRYQSNYGSRRRGPYTSGMMQSADKTSGLPRNYGGTTINNRNEPRISADMKSSYENKSQHKTEETGDKYPILETTADNIPDPEFTFPRWDLSGEAAPKLSFKSDSGSDKKYADVSAEEENFREAESAVHETLHEEPELTKPAYSEPDDRNERTVSANADEDKKLGGAIPDVRELFNNLDLSSSELLLIALIIYLIGSHSDDEMVMILLILLVLGFM